MEDTLRAILAYPDMLSKSSVLILVLMEDTLRAILSCFSWLWFQVLILVLMEDTLRDN